jgi:stress-induced-phosphoprotein 1
MALLLLTARHQTVQASLKNWDAALEDAEKCVEMKPEWPKGYSRLGGALYGKRKFGDAVAAYKKGLNIDGSNATLQAGLRDAEAAQRGPGARAARSTTLHRLLLHFLFALQDGCKHDFPFHCPCLS